MSAKEQPGVPSYIDNDLPCDGPLKEFTDKIKTDPEYAAKLERRLMQLRSSHLLLSLDLPGGDRAVRMRQCLAGVKRTLGHCLAKMNLREELEQERAKRKAVEEELAEERTMHAKALKEEEGRRERSYESGYRSGHWAGGLSLEEARSKCAKLEKQLDREFSKWKWRLEESQAAYRNEKIADKASKSMAAAMSTLESTGREEWDSYSLATKKALNKVSRLPCMFAIPLSDHRCDCRPGRVSRRRNRVSIPTWARIRNTRLNGLNGRRGWRTSLAKGRQSEKTR